MSQISPHRPQMTPEAHIWLESTKNMSRTPFQYKRVARASSGQKIFRARWCRAPWRFRRTEFFNIFLKPLSKNLGPGAQRPQSALIFPKHVILSENEIKRGHGGAGQGSTPNPKCFGFRAREYCLLLCCFRVCLNFSILSRMGSK